MVRTPPIVVELVEVRELSPFVRGMTFQAQDSLHWHAGQHIELDVDGEQRPYSFASAFDEAAPGRFELAVSIDDDSAATRGLAGLTRGARLSARGPFGEFRHDSTDDTTVFIATGTGLAPLRAMIQDALGDVHGPIYVLFGCRAEPDILWRRDFERWGSLGDVEVVVTLSQPAADWAGRVGYVQSHLQTLPTHATYYICGQPEMVTDVEAVLTQRGVPKAQRRTESYP